jgi:hypothetical protein
MMVSEGCSEDVSDKRAARFDDLGEKELRTIRLISSSASVTSPTTSNTAFAVTDGPGRVPWRASR